MREIVEFRLRIHENEQMVMKQKLFELRSSHSICSSDKIFQLEASIAEREIRMNELKEILK